MYTAFATCACGQLYTLTLYMLEFVRLLLLMFGAVVSKDKSKNCATYWASLLVVNWTLQFTMLRSSGDNTCSPFQTNRALRCA